ncbi:hypothetical protein [Evansella tamaricis]|uniref:Intracellular proteinase inhibitor BsuPI domain-containing protein n=1 Tax=Evansella tamaricis TaxID=2069301 RepID=A0ABS6JK27_9BACI|nr:hypothetical protein [Evansella tamaricis]MBU9713167.1 hypothetical protein [Evansella tamaricis]
MSGCKKRNQFLTIISVILYSILITGCFNPSSEEFSALEHSTIVSDTEAGDFLLRLIGEKEIYREGEKLSVKAKLMYVGEEEEMVITHDGQPFLFYVRENRSGFELLNEKDKHEDDITIKQGDWLEVELNEEYLVILDNQENNVMDFSFQGEYLPIGEYEIEVQTDFYTNLTEVQRHNYNSSLVIQIVE